MWLWLDLFAISLYYIILIWLYMLGFFLLFTPIIYVTHLLGGQRIGINDSCIFLHRQPKRKYNYSEIETLFIDRDSHGIAVLDFVVRKNHIKMRVTHRIDPKVNINHIEDFLRKKLAEHSGIQCSENE